MKGVNVRFKTPIPGLGHSCPVIWSGRVYLTTAISGDPKATLKPGQYGDVTSVDDNTKHAWKVYGREGEGCERCPGRPACPGIRRITQSARSTFYCSRTQR